VPDLPTLDCWPRPLQRVGDAVRVVAALPGFVDLAVEESLVPPQETALTLRHERVPAEAPKAPEGSVLRFEEVSVRGQKRPREVTKADGQREPAREAADPGGGLQRDRGRQRAEQQVEDAVGVGRLEEEVAAAPGRVGGVPGLREVDRLVDVGRRPRCRGRERRGHDRALRHGPGPASRTAVAAFACQATHL
jgi:hypothetical protein